MSPHAETTFPTIQGSLSSSSHLIIKLRRRHPHALVSIPNVDIVRVLSPAQTRRHGHPWRTTPAPHRHALPHRTTTSVPCPRPTAGCHPAKCVQQLSDTKWFTVKNLGSLTRHPLRAAPHPQTTRPRDGPYPVVSVRGRSNRPSPEPDEAHREPVRNNRPNRHHRRPPGDNDARCERLRQRLRGTCLIGPVARRAFPLRGVALRGRTCMPWR